jgi:chromosome segregation ATPase
MKTLQEQRTEAVLKIQERIADLEKENAELKETCNKWFEHLKNREEELLNELNNQNAKYESQIEELEKENAELKKQLGMSNKVYNDNLDYSHHIEGQLTKAKEIIGQLLLLPYANNEEVYADVTSYLDEAEQFLKDSEVEK